MQFYYEFASGLVLLTDPIKNAVEPGGTCAAYLNRSNWVTAKHCVPEGPLIAVMLQGVDDGFLNATSVDRHPTADLAVIHLPWHQSGLADQVFTGCADTLLMGGELTGFGYPMGEGDRPVGRIVKGHFQRYMSFAAPTGDTYYAGEMSVPVPGGLSGTAITYTHAPQLIAAIATTNIESSVTVEANESVLKDGTQYKETIKRVTTYGIAAMLHGHQDWLRSVVTSPPDARSQDGEEATTGGA